MALVPEAALKVALGENPKRVYGAMKKTPFSRMGNAAVFREALVRAQAYLEKQEAAAAGEGRNAGIRLYAGAARQGVAARNARQDPCAPRGRYF